MKYILPFILLSSCSVNLNINNIKENQCFQFRLGITKIDKVLKYGVETTDYYHFDKPQKNYYTFNELHGASFVDCEIIKDMDYKQ